MLGLSQKSSSKNQKSPWRDNPLEKLPESSPKTIGFSKQIKGLLSPDNMLDQLFGQKNLESTPDQIGKPVLKQEFMVFSRSQKEREENVVKESQIILHKLQEQIAILEKEEKGLSGEITKIKVEQLPRKTGIYYLRFLEWLLIVVKQLRIKVEEGRVWLSTFTERRKKKLGYWKMYKKHGTTFGLSQERVISTQTG